MDTNTAPHRRWRALAVALALITGLSLVGARQSGASLTSPDFIVKVRDGDLVALVGASDPSSLGGTSAPVYSVRTDRYLADFATEIQDGPDVETLLGVALATGPDSGA